MKHRANYFFLIVAIILLLFGTLFLATLSAPVSLQYFGNTNYYLFHQLISIAIGLVLGTITFKLPLRFLKKASFWLFVANMVLLAVVFVPVLGAKFWGAKRWISLGGTTFQPSEFLKITSILYVSAWLSEHFTAQSRRTWTMAVRKSYEYFLRIFLPFLALLAVITVILFFQKDISTLGIIALSLLAVYFIAGTPLWHTGLYLAGGISGALVLIRFEPYRMQRFLVFLHPDTDPLGIGFQLKQSLLAVGSGGILGKGWGMSMQKFGFLPQAMSDSVFAILGEELGLVGALALLILTALLIWQGLRIAKNSSDTFGRLAAAGICTWLVTQIFINIASSIGIFPLSGVPLPFFSYGGSHIVAEMIAMGLMMNISRT